MKYSYGWNRPNPNKQIKDFYSAPHMMTLPSSVDLSPLFPECYNQLQLGACSAHAAAGLAEFIMIKEGFKNWTPSRLAIYWRNRLFEHTTSTDSGASLHDSINSLTEFGCPHESIYPYDIKNFTIKPPKNVWSDGYWHTIEKGLSVNQDLNSMKTCLAEGYPFMLGFMVYESFESEAVAETGIMPMPKEEEKLLGGHAVLACGYENDTFIIRNSWSNKWGKNGYFYMPFEYILNEQLAGDFWTARNFVRFKSIG